jgi:hypothetical protein
MSHSPRRLRAVQNKTKPSATRVSDPLPDLEVSSVGCCGFGGSPTLAPHGLFFRDEQANALGILQGWAWRPHSAMHQCTSSQIASVTGDMDRADRSARGGFQGVCLKMACWLLADVTRRLNSKEENVISITSLRRARKRQSRFLLFRVPFSTMPL